MALSTSEKPMQHTATRTGPVGPRKPTRYHTFEAVSKSSLPATRSQTLPTHSGSVSHISALQAAHVDVPRKVSSSQPVASPLHRDSFSDSISLPPIDFGQSLGSSSMFSTQLESRVIPTTRRVVPDPRKPSGNSTDRGASGHLDLKRLLSKPAKHTPSGSSAISLPSDSEISTTTRSLANLQKVASSSQHSLHDMVGYRTDLTASPQTQRSGSRDTSSSSRIVEQEQVAKPRNVLRRRTSRPSTNPDWSAHEPAPHALTPKRRMRSIGALHVSSRPDTSPAATTSQKVAAVARSLTPAGQVALAYKQQEQRREELAETTESNEHASMHSLNLDAVEDEEGTGSVPYYTVFGSSSGHVVAAGGPLDFTQQLGSYVVSEAYAKKPPRSLSRRVSGRFKKVADIVRREREPSDGHSRTDSWRPYDGRTSIPRSPMRMSTDDTATQGSTHRSIRTTRAGHEKERSIREEVGEDSPNSHLSRSEKARERDDEEDAQAGGKWWKLVKRISTGGLRDKYRQSREATPPPVPPLPLDLQKAAVVTIPGTHSPIREGPGDGGAILRFMQSRASLSGVRPSTVPSPKTPSRHTTSRPSTGGKASTSASAHRPSTTTRSSSPISSDMASSGFFHRTHSTRSSSSSYGEEVPPMPNSVRPGVGQHILGPNELRRFDSDRAKDTQAAAAAAPKSRKPSRSHSEPVDHGRSADSPDECIPLPAPPRRRERGPHERSPSPTLPSFSTDGVVNHFASPALPLPEFGQIPPRPARSSRRKPASIELPGPSSTPIHSQLPATPRTPRPHPQVSVDTYRISPSAAAHGQMKPVLVTSPTSSLTSPSSSISSPNKSPLTFREIESPRQAWTEQEKADKWEALLERSARAGGTLHLSESGLLSEQMRLSHYEEDF